MNRARNTVGFGLILLAKMQAERTGAERDDWICALRTVVGTQSMHIPKLHVERAFAHEDELILRLRQQGRLMP